jgi:hypothetical protein
MRKNDGVQDTPGGSTAPHFPASVSAEQRDDSRGWRIEKFTSQNLIG